MNEAILNINSQSKLDIRCIDDFELDFLLKNLSSFNSIKKISKYHDIRKKEFLLGRYSSKLNLKKNYDLNLLDLDFKESREPIWPDGFIGSISHSKKFVLTAVALKSNVLCLGIDIEQLGRINNGILSKVIIDQDTKFVNGLDELQLGTLIFSAKESFYKAIYPLYGHFFGFDYAYVGKVDLINSYFEISLVKDLNENSTANKLKNIQGKFAFFENHLITLIEISSLN